MNIGHFGEKQFIREVLSEAAKTARPEDFDDCVIVDLTDVTGVADLPFLVYSLDHPSFVRHPATDIAPFRFYGRWVAAVTCNDVVAMGARCRGFSLDLSAPLDTSIDDVRDLLAGITEGLEHYGAIYEGGNFDANALETVGYAWGLVSRRGLVRRAGARPGDLIAVTGGLGTGWVEYQIRKAGAYTSLPLDVANTLREYKRLPFAAAEPIAKAAEFGLLTSGMDLSDGLVEFLHTICERNGLGVVIDASRLPVPQVAKAGIPLFRGLGDFPEVLQEHPELFALEPGYDSPLVHAFTVSADRWTEAARIFEQAGSRLNKIGVVVADPGPRLSVGGKLHAIPAFWDDQCRRGSTLADWFDFLRELMSTA